MLPCGKAKLSHKQGNAMLDLKTVIDSLPIAIIVIDRDRRILLSNRLANTIHFLDQQKSKTHRFGDIVGCTNANDYIAGCGSSELCHLCQVKAMIDKTFAIKKSSTQFETNISTCSLGVRNFRITTTYISLIEMPPSEQEICIVTIEDMTELKKKECLAAASETIGAICHEMNQPLQAIMGNVELLAKLQLEDGALARIEKICREIERIKSINSQLMNVTSYQTKPYLSTKILDIERSASN